MSALEVLTFAFSIASILVGAATFLLGFYLVERNRGVPNSRLRPFKYLLLSLLLPLFILVPVSIAVVFSELTTLLLFVVMCTVVFYIPVFSIILILGLTWS